MPVHDAGSFHGSQARSTVRRALALAAGLALVVTLASCDGECDNPTDPGCPSPPPPTPTPIPCTQSAVLTSAGAVPSSTLIFEDFPLVEAGRLDLTLDWTNAPSLMGLYLVPAGTCTLDEFNQRTCNFIVRSEPSAAKPRKTSVNVQAGNYRYIVANFSSSGESSVLQIVLSKGNCPAVTGVPPAVAAHDATSPLVVGRAERR